MSNHSDSNTDSKVNDSDKSKQHRHDKQWEQIKEFEKNSIVVIISKLPLPLPRYSLEIAYRTTFGDQKIGRHFQVSIDRRSGRANIVNRLDTRTLVTLVAQAYDFIENEEKLDIKEFMEWKKQKESEGKSVNSDEDDEVLIDRKLK